MSDSILGRSLVATARLIADRELSPVEVVTASLDRAAQLKESHGAFVTVDRDGALAAARQAEDEVRRGRYNGALHGIPIAVKDLIAVEGLPMTAGSAVLEGFVPDADAAVVRRVREASGIIVGTAALDEFAFSTTGDGIMNPVDGNRSPGGSSGGSAVAVAARACFAAIGTDTGGSVRIPAACCDIVGLKPTFGRVDTAGVVPLAWSLDHVGLFGRSVRDATAFLASISDTDSTGDLSTDLTGLRIGVPDAGYLAVADEQVVAAFGRAVEVLEGGGASVHEVELPPSEIGLNLQYLTVLPEAASYHAGRHPGSSALYGSGVCTAIEWGRTVRATEYLDAQRVRTSVRRTIDALLSTGDVLALPTMPITPPRVGTEEIVLGSGDREDVVSAMLRFTCLFNHTGHPAISVPTASSADSGCGLQLVGRHNADRFLLAVAASYEAAAG